MEQQEPGSAEAAGQSVGQPEHGAIPCLTLAARVMQDPMPPGATLPAIPAEPTVGVTLAGLQLPPEIADPPGMEERANKWAVLVLAGTAAFMTTLDSSIVNIGLPSIAHSFGVPLSGAIEWVIIGYLVVIAAGLLTAGRLADMIGRKLIFVAGIAIFTLGSAICGAAPTLGILIAARCFQGLGGALIFSVNITMITHAFSAKERGRALGTNGVLVALGVSAGPTLGGIITQSLTWRWIFYLNVPIGIVLFILALRTLTEPLRRERGRFDPAGAVLLTLGMALLTLGLSFGQEWGWTSPRTLASLLIGAAALAAAILVERWVKDPVLDLKLFKNRVFTSANSSFILCMMAIFAVGFLLPFYLEELRGYSVEQAGLLLIPMPISFAAVAPLCGMLADRYGSRWLSPFGLALACIGLVLLSQLDTHSSFWDILWRQVIVGMGQGIFQSPNSAALMGAAPANERGAASGILSTGRVVGQSLSVALTGAIFASLGGAAAGSLLVRQRHLLSAEQVSALQTTFVHSFQAALLVLAAVAALGILTALVRGNDREKRS